MLSNKIFDSLKISSALNGYLNSLDSYDDPYFMLISCEHDLVLATKGTVEIIKTLGDEVYGCDVFELSASINLFSISGETETIQQLSSDLVAQFKAEELIVHISIFHHNCLGKPLETFKWSTQLLEQIIKESANCSGISINDFTDHQNWPGIEQYTQ